ncbi:MAG: bifunctional nuclease family protein [Proteobacteria bacterium]|nr:bifunctional nuclease family protein [Pseudomonadota bacterium]
MLTRASSPLEGLVVALAFCLSFCAGSCREERPTTSGAVGVNIRALAFDPHTETPVILLAETAGTRVLPIWIGISEARSIAAELEGPRAPRPNAHDLVGRVLRGLDGAVERVVVTELREGIYFATLTVRSGDRQIDVDARPSDAIAVALRMAAPIFVHESLFDPALSMPDVPSPEPGLQL